MIREFVAELVSKYTFIEKAEIKGVYLYVTYRYQNKPKLKKISIRATKEQLIEIIESIKTDIGYYDDKKIRDTKVRESLEKDKNRPLIFANR